MKFNKDFYPTPEKLALKMIKKVNWKNVRNFLEPSAGDGVLIEHIKKVIDTYRFNNIEIKAIEIENDFQAILRNKGINVIDSDFLEYKGLDQFDLIIANFPFSNGHLHLMKAIDILYSGQIVCLINAETIRNPFSNDRKALLRRLNELNAEIEYIKDGFIDAERKTAVEVAMVYINIERDIEKDLLSQMDETAKEINPSFVEFESKDLAVKDNITAIVKEYEFKSRLGLDTILGYYKNFRYIGSYMELITNGDETRRASSFSSSCEDLTKKLKEDSNNFVRNIRKEFWHKTLFLPEVQARLTEKKKKEFLTSLKAHENMEFTERNVRQFMINLINNYEIILKDAIEEIFDMMTVRYSWDESIFQKNVRFYNGWKTNKSFKIGKKVILPHFNIDFRYNGWYVKYDAVEKCNDIDKVMNYFDKTFKKDYIKISDTPYLTIIDNKICIDRNYNTKGERVFKNGYDLIESEYFKIKFYKKGTMHLTFKDEDILRAFNIEAGKKKGWLPQSYGTKKLNELTYEEKKIVEEFEDNIKDYKVSGSLISSQKVKNLIGYAA